MDKKLIGYAVSSFGLGILISAIIYPMGYLESVIVYRTMTFIGTALIVLGLFIRPTVKKKENRN
ncbi:hypothetical protein CV093_10535 [Oceanobacillus sp. 143]|uniref:Uncharacterized protein n=1 Tax=Oceanobacillus zhaokaii TaxID=2052660 RepID=A0A345PGV9_9BACI|nr:hypothetical protein [Oceanobacillus zhaokaii]AXI09239.1 hypothetical protein CUC15_09985 [Oceanobacillus zhaokaii]QGS68753.1 hypothetical protein CV093_10535 [Oceanobacillus sp. 143]